MPVTLEQVIARVPDWANRTDVMTSPLHGGITNANYRVDAGEGSFVVRIPGADSELLGIDRRREHACTTAAAEAGVGPEVVHFFEDWGVLVTRFIQGEKIPPEKIRKSENIRRVVESLRRIHTGKRFPGTFCPFQTVKDYLRTARKKGVKAFPEDFDSLFAALMETEQALSESDAPAAPCHNDLLNENFLDDGKTIRMVDWEYAAMGDLFFDLGNFAVHHEFSDDEERMLLEAYFGRYADRDHARLKRMKIASDLREAMWGMVQIGISKLKFDFSGYANKHFDRFRRNLRDR